MITEETAIFWFRRDLRLEDNIGLYNALLSEKHVLCVFIFDKHILESLESKDLRVQFIHQTLEKIKAQLVTLGSDLLVHYGLPETFYAQHSNLTVYTNRDYEPYAIKRDEKIGQILRANGGELKTFKDQVIFESHEVRKSDGSPYTVFTPYSKKWKTTFKPISHKSVSIGALQSNFQNIEEPSAIISLESMGFETVDFTYPPLSVPKKVIKSYTENRDYPAIRGTSRLSLHLRFGTLSIRSATNVADNLNTTWLNELIWRNFYMNILEAFPESAENAFKPKYDKILWRTDEADFKKWCDGNTGYPLVDAGMRELNVTGFMHNRVRMVVASFLTKHLLLDWRWGERYFASKLLDFDLAANVGGWQWAAGSGCDAAPYFRVFNPELQMKKFDPDTDYVKKWVPEYGTDKYVEPMVPHKMARERAIKVYKEALNNG